MSRTDPVVAVLVAPDDPDPPGLEPLASEADVHLVRSARDLEAVVERLDVLAVYDFRTPLVAELGERAARLEWIHAASAGVDAVLTPAVAAGPTIVTNAQGVFDRPIAEYVLAVLLLNVKDLRRTLKFQRRRQWRHRETRALAGRHLLVVGAGSIGREVGRLGAAAGMEVQGIARSRRDDPVFGTLHPADELHRHLGWADDVVVCAPLTDETRGMMNEAAFAAMRPGAGFVNVGRGPIVDEAALLDALRSGAVGFAALDVFATEPLPPDHPFWEMDQVVVSPHMSGDEIGWRAALSRQFMDNFSRWRRGEPLEHVVKGDPVAVAAGPRGRAGSGRRESP